MALEDQGATPEVEEVVPATPEVPEVEKSMDDTIRDTLRELTAKGVEVDTPPAEPEEKTARIRDEKGKFAAKAPVDQAPVTPEPAAPVTPADPLDIAPNTWKKEVAATWQTLPPQVRAEVARREADFHKGIEGYKQAAGFGQAMERAITPYAQTIQKLGITADKAVSELMATDHKLRQGTPQEKAAMLSALAQNYGIDMAQAQAVPQVEPHVAQLQQEVRQLRGYIENQQSTVQRQSEDSLHSEISQFAADPSHSHFETVKGHMSALLQAGQATSLADAYEQAIYANPTTRALVLAEQQAAQRAEAARKAQAAREAASVNTRSRPPVPTSEPIGSMDDTIRATLRKLQAA